MQKINIIILAILLTGIVSAYDDIGFYKLNNDLPLNLGCSYNNTYCPSSFSCNITIYNKDGVLINNKLMDTVLAPQYNFTIPANNLTKTGLYYGRQVCCSSSIGCSDYSFQFKVNAQGKETTSAEGVLYIALLLVLSLAFAFSLYGSLVIQSKNIRNDDGKLLQINWSKYLKMLMFAVSYVLLMGIFYFSWNLSYGVLEFIELSNIFYFLFRLLFIAILPIFIFGSIFIFIIFLQDKKWEAMLERGLTVKFGA